MSQLVSGPWFLANVLGHKSQDFRFAISIFSWLRELWMNLCLLTFPFTKVWLVLTLNGLNVFFLSFLGLSPPVQWWWSTTNIFSFHSFMTPLLGGWAKHFDCFYFPFYISPSLVTLVLGKQPISHSKISCLNSVHWNLSSLICFIRLYLWWRWLWVSIEQLITQGIGFLFPLCSSLIETST